MSPSVEPLLVDARPLARQGLLVEELDGEAVLYDLAANAVHYLNQTGYFLWQRCDGRQGSAALARELDRAFEGSDDPLADVHRSISDLAANGLVTLEAAS